jgi:hypothetical protein
LAIPRTNCGPLERLVDRDADLPDHHRGNQGGGHGAEADPLVGEFAEVVPEAEREKNRDFGVLLQRGEEPVDHGLSLPLFFARLAVSVS